MFIRACAAVVGLAVLSAPSLAASGGPSELTRYAHARLADFEGRPEVAAQSYALLLKNAPGDQRLAFRTYRQALAANDAPMALYAAHLLDKTAKLPAEGSLLLLAEAVKKQDWDRADQLVARVERERVFAFLMPMARGWISFGKGDAAAIKALDAAPTNGVAGGYARNHRVLMLLATGQESEGVALLGKLAEAGDARALRLQLAAAGLLNNRGNRAGALALLAGSDAELLSARHSLAVQGVLPGAIDTPALAIAELLAQFAMDVKGGDQTPIALQLVRIATYLAPNNGAAQIAAADILSESGMADAALKAIDQIRVGDPLREAARQVRLEVLVARGQSAVALREAEALAARADASPDMFVQLGGILADLDRPAEAAIAYGKAIERAAAQQVPVSDTWTYWFLRAGARDRAHDWDGARSDLLVARRIAPRQAIVLNYLGYAMLERGEDMDSAEKLIRAASVLKPDDAAISDSLGWLYYRRGNLTGAIAALEQAVTIDPAQPMMNEHLGDAYWRAGRRLEARYAWSAAMVHADAAEQARISRKLADGLVGTGHERD